MPGQCSACRTHCDDLSQHRCTERARLHEWTPDGHPQVWLLYRPEPFAFDSDDDRSIHLWVRRCDVFTSRAEAIAHLDNLLGHQVRWDRYADLHDGFWPELWIGKIGSQRWLMCAAPVNPPGGQR